MPADYYLVLGISRGADLKKIKSAYRKVAKQHHPDITRSRESTNRFREIKEAYETLADDKKRKAYDAELDRQTSGLRITNSPDIIRRRNTAFDELEKYSTFVDEFFEGFLPGFFDLEKSGLPGKNLYYEIMLSPREASAGGLFPITVPVVEACRQCGKQGSRKFLSVPLVWVPADSTANGPFLSAFPHKQNTERKQKFHLKTSD